MSGGVVYPAVRVEGGLLPSGLLQRIGEGDQELPGSDAASYGLQSGESVRRYASRSFAYLQDVWREFAKQRSRAGDTAPARLARERWLLILLRELGYDPIESLPGGITVDDKPFPVSHRFDAVPVHLLGWGIDLDRRTANVRGAAVTAPHSMLQQLLNRTDAHLWAVLSNGQKLRLLRDSTSLVGSAYVEFDLEAIFDGDLFPDFVLLYRLAHASRAEVRDATAGPSSCLLEQWRSYGAKQGERALEQLRDGVETALEVLGSGFLDHPDNAGLRAAIEVTLSLEDYKRSLLRLVYRLLFWFVAEDRDVLLDPEAAPSAKERYDSYFSSRRLRGLALRRRYSSHSDLWESVRLVFDILGREGGHPRLALPGIGGLYEPGPLDRPLAGARVSNAVLLQAVEALAVLPGRRGAGRQRVDFRHLGAEELGSVYESLLELRPRWDPAARRFHAERLAGNERKTTGSYYTPSSLVECLLDSALDPLLDEAVSLPSAPERVAALLDLTVCDPACGSGHFLIAAARRIAKRLAAEETQELEPTPAAVRSAMRRVVGRCIYGVDVNEMAAELAKVSLWLEAMEPGRPLGYLDANIRVGNSLLGVTPRLLRDGIPDSAFAVLTGDERKVVASLKRQNAVERSGQGDLFGLSGIQVSNVALAASAEDVVYAEPRSLADVHVQAKRAQELESDRRHARLVADAWCAAFVQPKMEQTRLSAITQGVLERLDKGELSLDLAEVESTVESLARQYRFFHWHIEFPHIFRVPEQGSVDEATGWQGGFSCVLGNPPWDQVEFKEQEFFAARAPEIARAANASARKKMIEALATADQPEAGALRAAYLHGLREIECISHLIRSSGRYPLTGLGRLNTYAAFAETASLMVTHGGRVGNILPTGIATDYGNKDFCSALISAGRLVHVYDFRNNRGLFKTVGHGDVHFCLFAFSGRHATIEVSNFAFNLGLPDELSHRDVTYSLRSSDILLVNPNTKTCPSFTSPRAARLVAAVYRRVPVLWREGDPAGNPWNLWFRQGLFNMATDSGLFRTADQLEADGWTRAGNQFVRRDELMLPLYEGKMIYHFDHRFGDYASRDESRIDFVLPRTTTAQHNDVNFLVASRYWVSNSASQERLGDRWSRGWLLGWRDIARSTDERTLISTVIPRAAVGHTIPLAMCPTQPTRVAGLLANLSSYCLDYVVRQKASGTHLTYMYMKQFPVLPPESYDEPVLWDRDESLERWITPRVLELTYTAYDIAAYARDLGDDGPPFRWDPARRELMRAELDAAYFHLYGIERSDAAYIMDTFKVVRQKDEAAHGEYRTKHLILERYDAMADAIRTDRPYRTPLNPPPGQGPRHPAQPA